ncbi:unnamed protein product [Blepharisma stoltei]|uniref:FHA domain-containing protein n=1 Tax=Blepharisma stoltei TaxID=1481888 RepID=A0AAU9JCB5_9CILI|nr:unnamed protein product [Blepharisma stoltei]
MRANSDYHDIRRPYAMQGNGFAQQERRNPSVDLVTNTLLNNQAGLSQFLDNPLIKSSFDFPIKYNEPTPQMKAPNNIIPPVPYDREKPKIQASLKDENSFEQKDENFLETSMPRMSILISNPGQQTEQISVQKPQTIIGVSRNQQIPDYILKYHGDAQMIFQMDCGHLLAQESSTDRYVACKRVPESPLTIGSVFKIGSTRIQVEDIKRNESITFKIFSKDKGERLQTVARKVFSIGRSSECAINLSDDYSVSKKHADVEIRYGIWVISDAGSKMGIFRYFHNKSTLERGEMSPLMEVHDNDIISLGGPTLSIEAEDCEN